MNEGNPGKKTYIKKWQIAYAAKKLRKEKRITLTCLKGQTSQIIDMLSSFSYSNPILKETIYSPNSQEVCLEIVNP